MEVRRPACPVLRGRLPAPEASEPQRRRRHLPWLQDYYMATFTSPVSTDLDGEFYRLARLVGTDKATTHCEHWAAGRVPRGRTLLVLHGRRHGWVPV